MPAAPSALILVADDLRENVELLHDQLTALCYRVVSAADSDERKGNRFHMLPVQPRAAAPPGAVA